MEEILKQLHERVLEAYKSNVSCTLDLHKDSNAKPMVDVNFTFSVGGYVPESRTMTTSFSTTTGPKTVEQRLARLDKFLKETKETTVCY